MFSALIIAILATVLSAAVQTTFTVAEVAQHNTVNDLWMIIAGDVYDITSFVSAHPGGKAVLVQNAGNDVTAKFKIFHKSSTIAKYGPLYRIGTVGVSSGAKLPAPAPAPAPAISAPATAPTPVPIKPTAAPATGKSCGNLKDTDPKCSKWGAYCADKKYSVWMRNNCAKVCCQTAIENAETAADETSLGQAGSDERESTTLVHEQSKCDTQVDTSNLCGSLIQHCTPGAFYYNWMTINCQRSCCGAVGTVGTLMNYGVSKVQDDAEEVSTSERHKDHAEEVSTSERNKDHDTKKGDKSEHYKGK